MTIETPQTENEAAGGQSRAAEGGANLTAVLGALADQFECHALSRSIDDIEAAGRAMRDAKAEVERLRASLAEALEVGSHLMSAAAYERARKLVPNG
jgi:hypothetical protein